MRHDPDLRRTAMFVQMQKTILQLSSRVEALERQSIAQEDAQAVVPTGPELRAKLSMALMCENVAVVHGVSIAEMKAKFGPRRMVEARKVFCRMARNEGFSLARIGRFLGGRDHTTILHLSQPEAGAQ